MCAQMDLLVELLTEVEQIPVAVEATPPPTSPSWLRQAARYLQQTQKWGAYGMSLFLGLHLALVILVPGTGVAVDTAQEVFEMARNVYQGPGFEAATAACAAVHVVSGIGLRYVRSRLLRPHKRLLHEPVIRDGERHDIGLGGITALIGLGYKRLVVLTLWPSMSPLSFSGYMLLPLLAVHVAKFRYVPAVLDDDSSLVTLQYVTYVLTHSRHWWGPALNYAALMLLCWTLAYHVTSGLLRYNRKFTLEWKKVGYGVIAGVMGLAVVSVERLRRAPTEGGFLGKAFTRYAMGFLF